ncbi:MAG TPA: hypothetical protein VGL93_12125 [Streptosporangiaceae bacterium]
MTADQVATLRAYLSGDNDEFQRLNATLDRSPEGTSAYAALVLAAFVKAVDRRFTADTPRSEVVQYVRDVRSRSDRLDEKLDQDAAERLILSVNTSERVDDLDARTRFGMELVLLAALIGDERLSVDDLEAFLAQAHKFADQLLG